MKSKLQVGRLFGMGLLCAAFALSFGAIAQTAKADVKVRIKIATVGNPGDGLTGALNYFTKTIAQETNGAVAGEVFVSSQLGSYTDYIDGLRMGSIQMAEIDSSVLSTLAPKFSIFGIPYVASSPEALRKALAGKASDILNKDLDENGGLVVLGWIVRPARNVYGSKMPIKSVADMKGLKIRTMQSPPMLKAMGLLGANPTPIPTNERYLALQTKVVDAAENNLVEIYNAKEYEVTKYLSLTEHIVAPSCIVVSKKFLDGLSAEYRAAVIKVGRQAGEAGSEIDATLVKVARENLGTKGGMIINEVADKGEFMKKVAPLRDEYMGKIGAELFDLIQGK
jgi:tripartite ATP-independent transporter DctP family solute receptor